MHLGEFGAYDKAPMDSRARYTAAVARAAERLGWSWAYWQFDSDFVVYDIDKDAWVEPLRKALIPYAGSPFGDSRHPRAPQKIPGRLQCELYDVGGPGVAYSDSDGKNSGSGALNPLDGTYLNAFRADEAVDISYTKDRGTPTQDFSEFNFVTPERDSLYVGWTEPGEWVHYTVLVEKTGRYSVDVMYTSNGEGRFELSVDGVPRGTITLPTTHRPEDPVAWRQWHHWNRRKDGLDLELAAGLHLVRIRLVAGNTNLDYLEIRPSAPVLQLNELEYLEMPGLNVMLAHDYYPEGHQGGVGIIQNGLRVATNGDIRLDRTPGQWQPVPKVGKRVVDKATGEISLRAEYPDESKNRKGFNPVDYPDLRFAYTVRVRPEGQAFRILVDLEQPLPDEWIGKVGFNMELFPGILFGKTYATESSSGIFPRQANGPGTLDAKGEYQIAPLATGKRLVIAPESDRQRMAIEDVTGGGLELVDGRGQHNNGWFVVRSLVAKGATKGAVEWLVTPHALPGFVSPPTVQVSQVGYHPKQQKWAIVELDARDARRLPVVVSRITETGALEKAMEAPANAWGRFLRYDYLRLDFTSVEKPGMYVVSYGDARSNPFRIAADVYERHVWQPTVESFLPIQMCHVRVNERYRVWHDACHLDDARMAPVSHNHFDGYFQGPSTLTKYSPGEPVPGLDRGGWHDAGDDDLRVESQAETMHGLALAWEAFRPGARQHRDRPEAPGRRDAPARRQARRPPADRARRPHRRGRLPGPRPLLPRHHHPDPAAVHAPRRLRGPDRQRGLRPEDGGRRTRRRWAPASPGSPDDRWVFTEQNPRRELSAAAGLAASARALRGYDDALAAECLSVAKEIWDVTREDAAAAPPWERGRPSARIGLAVELLITTKDRRYADYLVGQKDAIVKGIRSTGWVVGRALPLVGDAAFTSAVTEAVKALPGRGPERSRRRRPTGCPTSPTSGARGGGSRASAWSSTSSTRPSPRSSRRTRCSTPSTSCSASTPGRTTPPSSRAWARGR